MSSHLSTPRMRVLAIIAILAAGIFPRIGGAQDVLIPMDAQQSNHLKAYGLAYWALQNGEPIDWLLNYRGGSFLLKAFDELESELAVRGVFHRQLSGSETAVLLADVESERANTAVVRLEKPPRIAVYAPIQTLPWDDAVLLALTFAEVPYDIIYDDDVLLGRLNDFDWLHLHHEDFTGQYGKFFQYRNMPWYIEQQRKAEDAARRHGFRKVSALKLSVAQTIRQYVLEGGFLFAMCSGTDTYDISLSAHATDVVPADYDGDPVDPGALDKLDYSQTFAFTDFRPSFNASEYEHSDVDTGPPPQQLQHPALDYFTLFEFSAKWDPVPSMLTQNHVATVKGFIGQTTAFRKRLVKPNVVILAEAPLRAEVKYFTDHLAEALCGRPADGSQFAQAPASGGQVPSRIIWRGHLHVLCGA